MTTCASLSASTTTPFVGESIEVSGQRFRANESGALNDVSSLILDLRAAGTGGSGGGSNGGTAFTGVEIAGLLAAAAIPVGGGAFFVMAGRRRKTARA